MERKKWGGGPDYTKVSYKKNVSCMANKKNLAAGNKKVNTLLVKFTPFFASVMCK